jgi:predicted metalloprotease with PDZ domain
MKFNIKRIMILLICFQCSILFGQKLNYQLGFDTELYKQYNVQIHISENQKSRLVFAMPSWLPGSYYVNDYGKTVTHIEANNTKNEPLPIIKLSVNEWEVITNGSEEINFSYNVSPDGHNFLGSPIDSAGALVQGASTWMYVKGMEKSPVKITINPPNHWTVSTALKNEIQNKNYSASNYDQLADCPIMLGNLRDTTFTISNIPHEIAFRGEADFDLPAFTKMVKEIVQYQVSIFNEIPYDRYVFQYSIMPGYKGGGGLEHATSTSIGLSGTTLLNDVKSAANITAHEYFHLWNVKRITNKSMLPLDYQMGAKTTSLWWLEGMTSYYAALTLVRTGLWTKDKFTNHITRQIVILQQNSDRFRTSVSKASWSAWERGYYTTGISYYNKGQLVGFLLDIMIRQVTGNKKTLDDVFRYLYLNYAKKNKSFKDGEIQTIIEEITEKDFSAFFDRYVTGTVELPYLDIMKLAGFDVNLETQEFPSLGRVRFLGKNKRVYSLDAESTIARAGIRKEDELVSLNGKTFENREEFLGIISQQKIGELVKIRVRRDGVYLLYEVKIAGKENVTCSISMPIEISQQQIKMRTGLLTGKEN